MTEQTYGQNKTKEDDKKPIKGAHPLQVSNLREPQRQTKGLRAENKSMLYCNVVHKSSRNKDLFLIDVTISKVTTAVNHRRSGGALAILYPGCISVLLG